MRIVCDGLDLADSVMKVSKGLSSRVTNPILEGIKMVADDEKLTLSATDLEISIEKTIKAEVKLEGETVVPGKFFCEYLKKLTNEQIELDVDEKNMMMIKYTDSVGKVQCLNAGEFPIIKQLENCAYFEITQKDLKSIINKTLYAVAVDDNRPILKGCKFEIAGDKLTAIALDGFRLAMVKKQIKCASADMNIIVPGRSLNEIGKLLEDSDEVVRIYVDKHNLMIEIDSTKITTRLLEGEFINYKQIIPDGFSTTLILNKGQLEDALERVALISRVDKNNLVKYDIKDKKIVLTSRSDTCDIKETITVSQKGNDMVIAFNSRYFIEALRSVNDEFVRMNFTSNISPCIITQNVDSVDESEYLFLILPVRLV